MRIQTFATALTVLSTIAAGLAAAVCLGGGCGEQPTDPFAESQSGEVGRAYLSGDGLYAFQLPDGRLALTFFVSHPRSLLGQRATELGRSDDPSFREEIWVTTQPGGGLARLPFGKRECWLQSPVAGESGLVEATPVGDLCVGQDGLLSNSVQPVRLAAYDDGSLMKADDLYQALSPTEWVDIGHGLLARCDPRGARGSTGMPPACTPAL